MSEEFKRLKRELVYKGAIVDFYKDTILVPNGNIVEWDFIGHQGAAAGSTGTRWTDIRLRSLPAG